MSEEKEIGNREQKKISIKTSDANLSKELEKFEKEYQNIATTPHKPVATKDLKLEKDGFIKRKWKRIKNAMKEFWVVGKHGFKFGFMAGGALGFLLGLYESIRMRSIIPLPIAIVGSGFTFGCIFAVSTVVRTESDLKEEICFEIGYFEKGEFKVEKFKAWEKNKL
jgi:hypothetical protein